MGLSRVWRGQGSGDEVSLWWLWAGIKSQGTTSANDPSSGITLPEEKVYHMCNVCVFTSICIFKLHKHCSYCSQSLLASCFHKSAKYGPTPTLTFKQFVKFFLQKQSFIQNCGFLIKCSLGQFPILHEGGRTQKYCYRKKIKFQTGSDSWVYEKMPPLRRM